LPIEWLEWHHVFIIKTHKLFFIFLTQIGEERDTKNEKEGDAFEEWEEEQAASWEPSSLVVYRAIEGVVVNGTRQLLVIEQWQNMSAVAEDFCIRHGVQDDARAAFKRRLQGQLQRRANCTSLVKVGS
jgi:hypothetical protein